MEQTQGLVRRVECGVAVNQLVIVRYHLLFIVYSVVMVLFFPAVVTCPTLTNPDNGMVDVPSNNFESIATYACGTGYMLTGDVIRVCEVTGDWSGTASTCDSTLSSLVHLCTLMVLFLSAVVTCPALSDPTNGMVDVPSNNFGSIATYACGTGYTLNWRQHHQDLWE